MSEAPPATSSGGAFDVVAGRNVLIYFAPEARARALRIVERAVAPGGLLVLGPTDPPPSADDFAPIASERAALFRRHG
jgi:chemotaxis methyl-accepting protein methylase